MNNNIIRQVVLDTETTGMNKCGLPYEGHRVIEIGAVEIINRRLTGEKFHTYLRTNCTIDVEAFHVHGISDDFLCDKPDFSSIVNEFLKFIKKSELIIHNASFDLGFLNQELKISNADIKMIESCCVIIDTLKLARRMFPGQRNSLDALCERYFINRDKRGLHNALIDAQLLANVFLSMTGGQTKIKFLDNKKKEVLCDEMNDKSEILNKDLLFVHSTTNMIYKIIRASDKEKLDHDRCLDIMQQEHEHCLWRERKE